MAGDTRECQGVVINFGGRLKATKKAGENCRELGAWRSARTGN